MTFGIYGASGFQLALTVVAGLYLGGLADKKWGTSPWLTVIGLLVGVVGGFTNFIKILYWKNNRLGGKDDDDTP